MEITSNDVIIIDEFICDTCPVNIFIEMINIQKEKEDINDIWKNSKYKDLVKLQSNNVGNVGETFIQKICDECNIISNINGSKTKELGGGYGDGTILDKNIEIKTCVRGSTYSNFQHELGECPWKTDFMIFIDVSPECIYLTIFKNFTEEMYKSGKKCIPYFPTKSITWRKQCGAFKLDTTIKINEENILAGNTLKINNDVKMEDVRNFILSKIE